MKRKYYIATKLDNAAAHNALRDLLNFNGHELTYDWTEHGPVYDQGIERIREVATNEIEGVRTADVVIVISPGGRGTHVELGAAIATDKPVILLSENDEDHEISETTCVFYHHPNVRLVHTPEDVVAALAA